MKFQIRITKNNDVSVHKQIVTQIKLGIFSGQLKPGDELPSRADLAKMLEIHENTVSAAYRELAEPQDPMKRPWIERRKGKEYSVRSPTLPNREKMDQLIDALLDLIHNDDLTLASVEARLRQLLASPRSGQVLVIEPDPDLREILMAEIVQATGFKVVGVGLEECCVSKLPADCVPVATYARAAQVYEKLSPDTHCLLLRVNSVEDALNGEPLPPPEARAGIGVASRSALVRQFIEVILKNMGYEWEAVNIWDTRLKDWGKRLLYCDFAFVDAYTAACLPAAWQARVKVFRIIAQDSLKELQGMFASGPLTNCA